MKPKLLLPLIALLFCSCATAPLLITTAITNGLQFGIKDSATRAKVACQITAVTAPLRAVTAIPDAAGFHALLDKYLPDNSTKAVTESNLVAVYSLELPNIQKAKAPLTEFNNYLNAVDAGASPFCPATGP